jgi:hypothetical protein
MPGTNPTPGNPGTGPASVTTDTTIKQGDTIWGYARFYESKGIGIAAANLATIGGLNPQIPNLAQVAIGAVLHLPTAWVTSAGLPPGPTANYA